jgi:hypothetical protein
LSNACAVTDRRFGSPAMILPRAGNLLGSELAQNVLACGGKRGCLRRQALQDAAAAGRNTSAQRANISTACRPQNE